MNLYILFLRNEFSELAFILGLNPKDRHQFFCFGIIDLSRA